MSFHHRKFPQKKRVRSDPKKGFFGAEVGLKMSAKGRLLAECQQLAKQTQGAPSLFAFPGEDLMHWSALIVGPPNTPYERGMFHFSMQFNESYPNAPPVVQFRTTSSASVRFNPNLYSNGKVCLSILGTWRGVLSRHHRLPLGGAHEGLTRRRARAAEAGESWSPVQNISSILASIQSLMSSKAFHNEPGFELDPGTGEVERYNEKIEHETLRVAIVEVLENTYESKPAPNGAEPIFADLRKQLFLMFFASYMHRVDQWRECRRSEVLDGRQFTAMPFECPSNSMKGTFMWTAVRAGLLALHERALAEIQAWREEGVRQMGLLRSSSAIGVLPAANALQEQLRILSADTPEGVSLGTGTDSALLVEATLFGPEGTVWEGGCFGVEIVYPPSYPER